MGTLINLIGQRFGKLVVIERAPNDKHKKAQWLCQCDCGNQKIVAGASLRKGYTKSCGCEQYSKPSKNFIDETNNTYGLLTVLNYAGKNSQGKALWKCKCQCGNECIISGVELRHRNRTSCGCLNKIKAAEIMRTKIQPQMMNHLEDLTGQVFDKLTVLGLDPNYKPGQGCRTWLCQCECGNLKTVTTYHLHKKLVRSCGCLGNSVGEDKIKTLLIQNHIPFNQEVMFSDLIDEAPLRFDFAIYNENNQIIKLIEYDGRQHSDLNSIWHTDKVLLHDKMKNEYCHLHHIPLLRIPYTKLENINLDMLLNEVSE